RSTGAAKVGYARSICAAPASPGCSPAASRHAARWKARGSTLNSSAAALWASCCSATAPLLAANCRRASTLRPGCRQRYAHRRCGLGAAAFAVASWACWSPRSSCLHSGRRSQSGPPQPLYNSPHSIPESTMYQNLLKSLNRLHPRAWDFIQLMRLDRPIGTYLLLWPTLWALWIAAGGLPSVLNLFVFITGVILMRAAGCVINDFADRNFDGHVARTRERPMATGRVKPQEAWIDRKSVV